MNCKKFLVGILPLCLALPTMGSAETYVSGAVSGTWNMAGSPYLVVGNLTVPANSSLIIQSGVDVIFQGDYEFEVDGEIQAWGAEDDSIYFTSIPSGHWGGFIYMSNPDTSRFYYCLFENANTYPDGYGGAFFLYQSKAILEHCTFQHNWANRGAAMYSLWGHVQFRFNVCWDNHVYHCGGALNFGNDANSIIERSVFYDNSSSGNPGGAIYFWDDHCRIVNCTFANNSSPAMLTISGSTSAFENCIFWYNDMGWVPEATYCDIQGGWAGTGNINADPLFVNPGGNIYYLQANSPCIDAGNPASPLDPDGTIADMGAYYFDQLGGAGNLTLDLEPVSPPIIVPPGGGAFNYMVTADCDLNGYALFDFWADLTLPDGQTMGPLYIRPSIFLPPGGSISRQLQMYVSAWAMPGTYEFHGYLGDSPDSVWAEDYFTFTKQPMDGNMVGPCEAYITISGWDKSEIHYLPVWGGWQTVQRYDLRLGNSPEPFNPETVFQLSLPKDGNVKLLIYDLNGRLVGTLLNRFMAAGSYEEAWDAANMPSGMYLARLVTPDGTRTERCLLVK